MTFKSTEKAMPATICETSDGWLVGGDLLINNASGLLAKSASLKMRQNLQIDLGDITDADTSALGLVMAWQRRAEAEKTKIKIVNMPANLLILVDLYNIRAFISI
jgi:phospholipid transport system transporter-binding protein